jgi:hypothetical protein
LHFFLRCLGYMLGLGWWIYLRIPRFDSQRRSSARYRNALRITKSVWIGSGCIMLVLIEAFPQRGPPLSLALMLLTAFLSYVILDEIE